MRSNSGPTIQLAWNRVIHPDGLVRVHASVAGGHGLKESKDKYLNKDLVLSNMCHDTMAMENTIWFLYTLPLFKLSH